MTSMPCVILKPGKEKAVLQRHPWIFSGAIATYPTFKNGDILQVQSSKGECLGSGYFNRKSGLVGRMLSFGPEDPMRALERNLDEALKWRHSLFEASQTNAYRLINGEGDQIPGLVIDRYGDVFVLQTGTLGIDRLKPFLIDWLKRNCQARIIYEKSNLPTRKEEGLDFFEGYLFGSEQDEIEFLENGIRFKTSLKHSQKTGFFLDHREMRQLVRHLASGKRVLNTFSYTGGFSLYALKGGAIQVDSVDISEEAIKRLRTHIEMNGFHNSHCKVWAEDVFTFLREKELSYDLVILDPPAFAKKQKDVIKACRGYKDINRLAMEKMPENSLLLTSSCSYHVGEELFKKVIFQAALEAGRDLRIIGTHQLAADHPISIYHPEGGYLKSFLLHLK